MFILDPSVKHLISVARKCKSANKNAEFTVIGPLVRDETSDKKGFMTNTEATFAACIVKSSKNAMKIIKFLNWVYKNPENYNLCRYGIEGKHWVNNGDGTYSYPEGKDEYQMCIRDRFNTLSSISDNCKVCKIASALE